MLTFLITSKHTLKYEMLNIFKITYLSLYLLNKDRANIVRNVFKRKSSALTVNRFMLL